MDERRGEATLSVRIDGGRVVRLLLTRSEGRALRDAFRRARERLAKRSPSGRVSDGDLADLATAAIEAESLAFEEYEG